MMLLFAIKQIGVCESWGFHSDEDSGCAAL